MERVWETVSEATCPKALDIVIVKGPREGKEAGAALGEQRLLFQRFRLLCIIAVLFFLDDDA